jgi:hypothetical protein
MAVILANPVMINAYQAGIPGNGKPFPADSKMAKIHWNRKRTRRFPGTSVPASLHDVDFMVKDSKRFADSGGWGWAVFNYDAASDTFTPGTQADEPPQAERRQVWARVPHDREDKRLRLHGLREAVINDSESWTGAPKSWTQRAYPLGF